MRSTPGNPPIQLKLKTCTGPYRLPLCNRAGVHILDAYTAELILDTDSGQRILVRLTSDAIESLGGVVSFVLKRSRPANDDQN